MGCRRSGDAILWPNGLIPFEIDPNFTAPNVAFINQAIAHWNTRTAVRLVNRNGEADFIRFQPAANACGSPVGRVGGQQEISCALGAGFNAGSVIHEIGHAAGLWHEQSREDRNTFVTINTGNIQAGAAHNFDQHIADGDDMYAYDYGSIMHYGRTAFSSNGQDTITPTDPNAQIGQRIALSGTDILAINTMYTRTRFVLQTGSALHETDGSFAFCVADNNDLYAIKKSNTGSNSTEIHRLAASGNYQQFPPQTGTALHETDSTWAFALADNGDVFAIKKSATGSNSTEIHVLSAANNYQSFSLQTGTALHETDANFEFTLAPNRDLYAIKKRGTGTNSTEVHVLSASSNYQSFSLQTGTALHETNGTFNFALANSCDLYAFKKSNTGTNTTEVHVLPFSNNYQSFSLQKGTVLHPTDDTFAFGVTSANQMFAIKKRNTGTNSTEVHIVEL